MAEKGKLGKSMHGLGGVYALYARTFFDSSHARMCLTDPVIGRDEEIRRTIEGNIPNDILDFVLLNHFNSVR